MSTSIGEISIAHAARLLELPDAGYVLHSLADMELPLSRLSDDVVQLKNYERMKLQMERWIDLATELSTLRLIKETD